MEPLREMNKVSYGQNTRLNLYEVTDEKVLKASKSVACIISSNKIFFDENDQVYRLSKNVNTLSKNIINYFQPNCNKELKVGNIGFENEPSVGYGTGFLIKKNKLMTAFHVIAQNLSKEEENIPECHRPKPLDELQKVYVIFDFVMKNKDETKNTFPLKDVYRIEKIVGASYGMVYGGKDWAILKLDRDVKGRNPLELSLDHEVQENEELSMLGHPKGLPMKFSRNGTVMKQYIKNEYIGKYDDNYLSHSTLCPLLQTFQLKIDAFSGNSGSPVFDRDFKVVGILIAGNQDYVVDGNTIVHNVILNGEKYETCQRINTLRFMFKKKDSSYFEHGLKYSFSYKLSGKVQENLYKHYLNKKEKGKSLCYSPTPDNQFLITRKNHEFHVIDYSETKIKSRGFDFFETSLGVKLQETGDDVYKTCIQQ